MENETRKMIKPIVQIDKATGKVKKSPEEKLYLVFTNDHENSDHYWFICIGRTETYENIKDHILNDEIDVRQSFVLVEGKEFGTEITVYDFMKYMENFFTDNKFSIDDYAGDDTEEDNEYRTPELQGNQIDITASNIDNNEDNNV